MKYNQPQLGGKERIKAERREATLAFLEGLLGLVVFSGPMILIALYLLLNDGRPLLFRQLRLGKDKQPFILFKFRTMRGQMITSPGKWLRQTGLDELPQFLNILRGEMRVVGPRPLTNVDVERLGWNGQEYYDRWNCLPGLTGLSQIYAGRSARHSLRLDRIYLNRRAIPLDLRIIGMSFLINIFGKTLVKSWIAKAHVKKVF